MVSRPLKIAVIMGGKSGEHEVSLVSAFAIAKGLRDLGHQVTQIGITHEGHWVCPSNAKIEEFQKNPRGLQLGHQDPQFLMEQLSRKNFDLVFPVLHGTFGEDGTLQGLLEILNVPYVGSGVLASAVCMDKDFAKKIFEKAGIPVVPYKVIHRHEVAQFQNSTAIKNLEQEFGYPFFIKPCNSGSSVGVCKVKSKEQIQESFQEAFQFDTKVLVEKGIDGREIECSVLGNHSPRASQLGEIIPRHEFYSYKAKYLDDQGADLKIPAENISPAIAQNVRDLAVKAFLAAECSGLARVDFFLSKSDERIYINEINTMPGFTPISMYPKMWEASGLEFGALLSKVLDLCLERFEERSSIKTKFH